MSEPLSAGVSLRRRAVAALFGAWCRAATLACLILLGLLVADVLRHGWNHLTWTFLSSVPSRFPNRAGMKTAFWGSVWLISLTTAIAVPVGIATAVYLEEYARRGWFTRIIETNIANLAGVPSIIYGILGLGLFVRALHLQRSILAGAFTMSLVVLPTVIIAAQEALRAVPDSIRHASLALGATRWQTVRYQVLPAALPGLLTGVVLAVSRAMGEAAPLIMIGALSYIAFVPQNPMDPFTVLPIQIFNWTARPQAEFRNIAAAGILVLLALLLSMNALAIVLRQRAAKRIRW
jgi:phosphate transport system permease protein